MALNQKQVNAISAACRRIDSQVVTLTNLAKDPTLSKARKAEIKAAVDELNTTQDNLLDEVFAEDAVDEEDGTETGEGGSGEDDDMDDMGGEDDEFDVVAEGVDDIDTEDEEDMDSEVGEGEEDMGEQLQQLEARVKRLRAKTSGVGNRQLGRLEARVAALRASVSSKPGNRSPRRR